MVAHVVLLKLRATMSADDREALLDSMRVAFTGISEVRRVRIGKRILIGRGYETQMAEHFEYSAIIEFDSEADLRVYLDHPKHLELGKRFFESVDAALVYDYVTVEAEQVRQLLT
jgi:hypothetical protein